MEASQMMAQRYEACDVITDVTRSITQTPSSDMGEVNNDIISQTGREVKMFPMTADINTAAALRAQYAIATPKPTRRRHKKLAPTEDVEPLIDQTAKLELHSKKTERLQKRQQRRNRVAANQPTAMSLLDLPIELLIEVFTNLEPSDIFMLIRTCRQLKDLILTNNILISRSIIRQRYWTLHRCFPLPVPFTSVPQSAHASLLSPKRQEMLNIHRKSYHQHVQLLDPLEICTCMTCVFAWNNLCLIIDLNHWQHHLQHREPIPMIPRGTNPQWNQDLLSRNASLVRQAMTSNLTYACILQKHLSTITGTIIRSARWKKKSSNPKSESRLYLMTDTDVDTGTDVFLDRSGPPSYDFPFHRDNYYALEVYLPNRKWSAESRRWCYYALPPTQHEKDLEWVMMAGKAAVGGGVGDRGSGRNGVIKEEKKVEEDDSGGGGKVMIGQEIGETKA